jgi:dCTP deaminase
MILPDFKIQQWAESGGIEPFNIAHINPASVDLTLGQSFIDLETEEEHALTGSFWLNPGEAILATTMEYIRLPSSYAATVYLKSSMARRGLDHALAGWVDPGFEGNLTLELHSHRPIELFPCQRILQLVLYVMQTEPETPYSGRYQGQRGPTMARIQPKYQGGKIS